MPCDNIALIAAAGSGKTTYIVDEVTKNTTDKILLVTYTIANTRKLKKDIEAKVGVVPSNVEIMTWHSFLLQHCSATPLRSRFGGATHYGESPNPISWYLTRCLKLPSVR